MFTGGSRPRCSGSTGPAARPAVRHRIRAGVRGRPLRRLLHARPAASPRIGVVRRSAVPLPAARGDRPRRCRRRGRHPGPLLGSLRPRLPGPRPAGRATRTAGCRSGSSRSSSTSCRCTSARTTSPTRRLQIAARSGRRVPRSTRRTLFGALDPSAVRRTPRPPAAPGLDRRHDACLPDEAWHKSRPARTRVDRRMRLQRVTYRYTGQAPEEEVRGRRTGRSRRRGPSGPRTATSGASMLRSGSCGCR